MKTRIVIVDDHPVVRQGMKMYMELENEFEVCGEAGNTEEAINSIAKENPDLVTIDLSLEGDTSGLELIKTINKRFPNIHIIVVSMHDETFFAEKAMKAGAKAYILKREAQENIVMAIQKVLAGGIYISDEINRKIIQRILQSKSSEDNRSVSLLTNKEFEVFHLIGDGLNSKEISIRLNMSKNTVDSHKRHIKEKLNLKNSQDLIRYSVKWSMEHKV